VCEGLAVKIVLRRPFERLAAATAAPVDAPSFETKVERSTRFLEVLRAGLEREKVGSSTINYDLAGTLTNLFPSLKFAKALVASGHAEAVAGALSEMALPPDVHDFAKRTLGLEAHQPKPVAKPVVPAQDAALYALPSEADRTFEFDSQGTRYRFLAQGTGVGTMSTSVKGQPFSAPQPHDPHSAPVKVTSTAPQKLPAPLYPTRARSPHTAIACWRRGRTLRPTPSHVFSSTPRASHVRRSSRKHAPLERACRFSGSGQVATLSIFGRSQPPIMQSSKTARLELLV
jgi:hypothetical protein